MRKRTLCFFCFLFRAVTPDIHSPTSVQALFLPRCVFFCATLASSGRRYNATSSVRTHPIGLGRGCCPLWLKDPAKKFAKNKAMGMVVNPNGSVARVTKGGQADLGGIRPGAVIVGVLKGFSFPYPSSDASRAAAASSSNADRRDAPLHLGATSVPFNPAMPIFPTRQELDALVGKAPPPPPLSASLTSSFVPSAPAFQFVPINESLDTLKAVLQDCRTDPTLPEEQRRRKEFPSAFFSFALLSFKFHPHGDTYSVSNVHLNPWHLRFLLDRIITFHV